ncbi:MAG TPA: AAA family ATPase [Candidatus Limnocylindrales bacterium]
MPPNTILLLDHDQASARRIVRVLKRARRAVTVVTDPGQAIRPASEPQLIVMDVIQGRVSAVEVCREIRASVALVAVPVMVVAQTASVEERIRFLEAGADDVIAKPFDDREFEARIEALLLRFHRSKGLVPTATATEREQAREVNLVAVYSPKGGSGTTTIATNLAAAMAQSHPDRVALVDLDLQFGAVATHMNISDERSLSDAAQDPVALHEPGVIRSYGVRHDSGVHVFPAPRSPELAEHISADDVPVLLATLLTAYELVVVDAGSTLDDRTLAALEAADAVILPFYPEIPSLKAVNVLVDYLDATGSIAAKTTFVVNHLFAREIVKMRDVEQALGTKIGFEIPYDGFLYVKAVNEGAPLVLSAPKSQAAQRLVKLAQETFRGTRSQDAKRARPPSRGLVGLLRRS